MMHCRKNQIANGEGMLCRRHTVCLPLRADCTRARPTPCIAFDFLKKNHLSLFRSTPTWKLSEALEQEPETSCPAARTLGSIIRLG